MYTKPIPPADGILSNVNYPSLMFHFFFQFYDLLNIFKLNGLPSRDNPYLFSEFEYIQCRTIH